MGGFSVEGHPEILKSHGLYVHAGIRRAVHHKGNVNVLEAAVFLHDDLSADALLRRGAVNHDLIGLIPRQLLDAQGGSDNSGPLHVVAAAMSHGQSIVFRQQSKGGAAISLLIHRAEGSLHTAYAALHLKAIFLQAVHQKL